MLLLSWLVWKKLHLNVKYQALLGFYLLSGLFVYPVVTFCLCNTLEHLLWSEIKLLKLTM